MINFRNILSAENFKSFFNTLSKVHLRFPFTLLFSLSATIVFYYFIETSPENLQIGKLVATLYLAVPLMFSIEIFNERKWVSKYITIAFGFAFLIGYYLLTTIKNEYKETTRFQLSFLAFAILFHLFVSISPYLKKGGINSFWGYNKTLLLTIINAFIYSVTLSSGLCLAILAIDKLFDVNVEFEWYRNIYIFINGYINTVLFLVKMPNLDEIDNNPVEYPMGLKYFTQYVLLPLVAIYILIILAYEFKIAINWSLPKGWVSVLVMASAIFGILAFLLLYPLRFANKWVTNFTKLYYWLLIPLIILMMVAIYVRISEYGITEPRYFVAIMAIWLLGISLYFSISKIDNIKIIPISLIIICLFAIIGPFNAFVTSQRNQEGRLEAVLVKNKLLKNGLISISEKSIISANDKQKLHSSIDYLSKNKVISLQKYLSVTDFKSIAHLDYYEKFERISKITHLPIIADNISQRYYYRANKSFDALEGADYCINILANSSELIIIEKSEFKFLGNDAILRNGFKLKVDNEDLEFNFVDFTKSNEQNLATEKMTFLQDSKKWKLRLVLDEINYNNGNKIEHFWGKIYLTKK